MITLDILNNPRQLSAVSPSGTYHAVLRKVPGAKKEEDKQFIEVMGESIGINKQPGRQIYNGLYKLKVDGGMLNTLNNFLADISSNLTLRMGCLKTSDLRS